MEKVVISLIILTIIQFAYNTNAGKNPCEIDFRSFLNNYEIPCDDGECIRQEYWCDQLVDCVDGSDEKFCKINSSNHCTEKHFTCGNGICVPASSRCDGFNDCKDNSDEETCDVLNPGENRNKSDSLVITPKADSGRKFTEFNRWNGVCSWMVYKNTTCPRTNFLCDNKKCINRNLYCNGVNDCGDNSDEYYCREYNYCGSVAKIKCDYKCIPKEWFCDGIPDCNDKTDESSCESPKSGKELVAMHRGVQWLYSQRKPDSATGIWGPFVDKSSVALYFTDHTSAALKNITRKEITYEVAIQFLFKLSKKKLKDLPSTELASFLNAFLVNCMDPRNFHGINIVQELRNRVDRQNFTNSYVLLSLCNAGEKITESDKIKLIETFWNKRRIFWTDMQAVTIMALACANRQAESDADLEKLRELTLELKQHQYRNGTVENLQTTALVMQALFAAEPYDDPDNFDERKALDQIISSQKPDGSFGNFMNTYFVLPVLSCNSLVNISSSHCKSERSDGVSALFDLVNLEGPKKRIQYSLWIGNEKDVERNLVLRVPLNMSLYEVMETAAEIDNRYTFEYVVNNRKPYINAISDFQDNPELGKFWFLYVMKDGKPILSEESPVDVMPEDNDHFVMWYRSGSWIN